VIRAGCVRAVFALLRKYQAALYIHDLFEDYPRLLTADWIYLRFHGGQGGRSYSPQTLSVQTEQIRRYLDQGRDVFVYFNNDAHGYAVQNATELKRLVSTPSSSLMGDRHDML
jgi:uncharacterized protein YecE (DUF72 family)